VTVRALLGKRWERISQIEPIDALLKNYPTTTMIREQFGNLYPRQLLLENLKEDSATKNKST